MSLERWLSELHDVNPSGEAPHKPLLLLTVLKAAERDGGLPDVLMLSPELAYQFKLFEHVVAHRRKQKQDIRMPFHHLIRRCLIGLVGAPVRFLIRTSRRLPHRNETCDERSADYQQSSLHACS